MKTTLIKKCLTASTAEDSSPGKNFFCFSLKFDENDEEESIVPSTLPCLSSEYNTWNHNENVFEKYAEEFRELKINPNNGLRDLLNAIENLPEDKREEINREFDEKLKFIKE